MRIKEGVVVERMGDDNVDCEAAWERGAAAKLRRIMRIAKRRGSAERQRSSEG